MSYMKSAMFFLGLSLFVLGANAKAADYIVPCHVKDSADCYLSSARKALPNIAAQADPLHFQHVNADTGDLKFRITDAVLTNLANSKISKLERPDQFKSVLVAECPVTLSGKYSLNGTLLGIPVVGAGGLTIQTDAIEITINIDLKTYKGKDNEDHYKIFKFDYTYNPLTQVHYKFDNLYNGDATKAETMQKLFDDLETSKVLLSTIGKPVVEEVVKKIIEEVINKFFKENPAKDIELP